MLNINKLIDIKILGIGLGSVLLLYTLLFTYIALTGGSYVETLEKNAPKIMLSVKKLDHSLNESDHEMPTMDVEDIHTPEVKQKEPPKEKPYQPNLFEKTKHGMVPQKGLGEKDTIFHSYKNAYAISPDKKMIAIVLTGFGLSKVNSDLALKELPKNISLSLSPYADNIHEWAKTLRKSSDHEFWLSLPMEDQNYPLNDPGPKAILSRASIEQNDDNMFWTLSRDYGYAGVVGYADSAFLGVKTVLASMLEIMLNRGVAYFESNNQNIYSHDIYAVQLDGQYAQSDLIQTHGNFVSIMDTIQAQAKTGKVYSVALPLTPANIIQIKTWSQNLPEDTELAPLSAAYATYN